VLTPSWEFHDLPSASATALPASPQTSAPRSELVRDHNLIESMALFCTAPGFWHDGACYLPFLVALGLWSVFFFVVATLDNTRIQITLPERTTVEPYFPVEIEHAGQYEWLHFLLQGRAYSGYSRHSAYPLSWLLESGWNCTTGSS